MRSAGDVPLSLKDDDRFIDFYVRSPVPCPSCPPWLRGQLSVGLGPDSLRCGDNGGSLRPDPSPSTGNIIAPPHQSFTFRAMRFTVLITFSIGFVERSERSKAARTPRLISVSVSSSSSRIEWADLGWSTSSCSAGSSNRSRACRQLDARHVWRTAGRTHP